MMADSPGVRVVFDNIPGLAKAIEAEIERTVATYAHAIEADVKQQMGQAKSGRMYGQHQASAPGEAPAIDMGHLVNSVRSKSLAKLSWGVYEALYGQHLEYGTVRMAARPHMRPAADRIRKPFAAAITAILAKQGSK